MSEHGSKGSRSALDQVGDNLVADLRRQSDDNIRKLRAHERLDIRLKIEVRPGNSSDVQGLRARGVTADISGGGARLILPVPLVPGDVYRLEFDESEADLPMVFCRCLRARMVREGTFESSVTFFNKIALAGIDVDRRD